MEGDVQVLITLGEDEDQNNMEDAMDLSNQMDALNLDAIVREPAEIILCILWRNNNLGAAYFDLVTSQLYVLSDMVDRGPEFNGIRNQMCTINPKIIITLGTTCENFVKCIIDTLNNITDTNKTSDQIRKIPDNMFLLPFSEYSYDACQNRLFDANLESNTTSVNRKMKQVYLHSIIDFSNKLSIHALAALIKFTEKKWAQIHYKDKTALTFMHINQVSVKKHTLVDHFSVNALQIFENKMHDSGFNRQQHNTREGFSLYKMFATYCKTKMGCIVVKNILINPITDLETLTMRLDFIEFAADPTNTSYVADLQEGVKQITDIQTHLLKIRNGRGKLRDWKRIHHTIYHLLMIQESATNYAEKNSLLKLLNDCNTVPLYGIEQCISNCVIFDHQNLEHKPTIREGLDEELDAKRTQRKEIGKTVTAAANFAADTLPHNNDFCSIIYIPDTGHLIVLKTNVVDGIMDYQFLFELNGYFHYKNPMCEELDKQLGDIQLDIMAHENRILTRLANLIIEQSVHFLKPLEYLALMDCLISVAKVSVELEFVRPQLNQDSVHEIVEGRHPLLEFKCSSYVRNTWRSGGQSSKMKIITGPNGSGKTVFLKQIGLLIHLAHLGFYVPAKSANIGITDSIYSRLYAMESATLQLSSFQIDLSRMGHILNTAQSSSLILIDEFGKGSNGIEGLYLLASALKYFLRDETKCPHVLVSTHYEGISRLLPDIPVVSYNRMAFTMDENERVVFLYRLEEGLSSSFAIEVARGIGLQNTDILDEAENILVALKSGQRIREVRDTLPAAYLNRENSDDFFYQINIPELDDTNEENHEEVNP